jgi:hypothetical protein
VFKRVNRKKTKTLTVVLRDAQIGVGVKTDSPMVQDIRTYDIANPAFPQNFIDEIIDVLQKTWFWQGYDD